MNNPQERNLSLRRCSGLPAKLSKVSKFELLDPCRDVSRVGLKRVTQSYAETRLENTNKNLCMQSKWRVPNRRISLM